MKRLIALSMAAPWLAACATPAGMTDDHAPAAVVQAVDLTCGWLVKSSSPPTREQMEALGWRQIMTRADTASMPPMLAGQKLDPALAGYRLRFGETGDILASYWENRCYGILSNDLASEGDPASVRRAQQVLTALEEWVTRKLPDAVAGQRAATSGQERPFVARIGSRFVFSAAQTAKGGVEWRLVPAEALKAVTTLVTSEDERSL